MKKVLLIGADGMLGGELRERLEKKYEVVGTTLETLDICDKDAVLKKAREVKPYFIINCAAYTNVDACETHEALALAVNGTAVGNIAEAAKENDSTFIHISTDYVFAGDLDINKIYYILRTAWLYGLGGKNFVKTMLKLSKEKEEISVVDDQNGSPTSTTTLCSIIEQIMEKEPEYGVYHSTNEGFTTWCKFTKKIFELANVNTKVIPITSKQYKEMYPQSSDTNSMLSKAKLNKNGINPEKWEDALEKYLKEELK